MTTTTQTLAAVIGADQDFEWYPTTERMIDVIAKQIPHDHKCSILDIGAGDGRVLVGLARRYRDAVVRQEVARYAGQGRTREDVEAFRRDVEARTDGPELFGIEKSTILVQQQPEAVTPVGTDLFEQNLACLPVDYIFCNPPYSQFETWVPTIVEAGYAKKAFLIIPRRWKESDPIAVAIKKRGATARVIHSDDFHDAERRARAVVDIVEITYPRRDDYDRSVKDPFDIWFDQNISTFDQEEDGGDRTTEYEREQRELAKVRHLTTIVDLVEAYNEEYARMEENYRAIFRLDYALLRELGVSKDNVRDGIKKRMAGLKNKYWHALFEHLDVVTNRLATETKRHFLERIAGRTAIAFTTSNAYAVVLWAIKHANKYFDRQLVKLFRDLSTHDGVMNYKSNQRTWKNDGWRYHAEAHSHYALDYRIVVHHYNAIRNVDLGAWDYPGELHKSCHELIDDAVAVFHNLGHAMQFADREEDRKAGRPFCPAPGTIRSRERLWAPNQWEDFNLPDGRTLFQVKAFKNGNLHFRFMPEAIRALNVEAGRLLGWIRSRSDVVAELGYTPEEAERYFGTHRLILPGSVKLLAG